MTVLEIANDCGFEVLTGDGAATPTKVFCCDLLSLAMSRAPAGCAWVTVMSNLNTIAVSSLADTACVLLAEGVKPDEAMMERARAEEMTLLRTELPVFDAALMISQRC